MAVYILVQKLCQAVRVCKVNIEPGNCLDRDKAEGVGKCASRLVFIPPVNNGDDRGFPADDIADKIRGRFQAVFCLRLCYGLAALEHRIA